MGAGFLVFLIALPLCLGISTASGFPPVSGILTAIIGGIVVGPITGSTLSIKGPAAGLIAIAAAAVLELGEGDPMAGYRCTLAVIAVSGLVQVLFGALRLGRFTDFFPGAAVHGMLASIGIIIVAKQLPVLLGTHAVATSPLAMLAEAPEMLGRLNPEITLIGTLSLAVLFGFPFIKNRYIKMVPVPILVLAVGVALGYFFHLEQAQVDLLLDQSYPSGPGFLITLPDRFADGFVLPDLSKLFTLTSLKYIAMFAIVGSLESLLTVKAVEGLDPWKRRSDANRDLAAIGAGNAIAGSIGGLPMIAEVVRSAANVNNGARTQWSNVYHGIFLLVFVAFFPHVLHRIPLTALAAMLIYTGSRLASPMLLRDKYRLGPDQLAVFSATVITTLATDLLLGIAAGIVLKMAINLASGVPVSQLFGTGFDLHTANGTTYFTARECASFTQFMGFKKQFQNVPPRRHIVIDFSRAILVDHSFMESMERLTKAYIAEGGRVTVCGMEHLRAFSDHPQAGRRLRNMW